MNIKRHFGRWIAVVLVLVVSMIQIGGETPARAVTLKGKLKSVSYSSTPYGRHGKLKVQGTELDDRNGKPVRLNGVSTHGINWDVGYPYVNETAIQNLRDEWGVDLLRVAMYTEDYNGYTVTSARERKKLLGRIDTAVKATKKLGMYCIIDWHILSDGDPNKHKKEAKAFFKKMAKKYKKYGNVMFEICNEPNGGADWTGIKKYAASVISVIRKVNKKTIIIVGTPNWSQDVDVASSSPIKGYSNIMYAVHFYAATHQDSYRAKVQTALNNGLPVFCSEFSACDASGSGSYDFSQCSKWMSLFRDNNISCCAWSLSNKGESASLLKASCKKTSGFRTSDLSPMGKWLVKQYRGKMKTK